MTAEADDLLAGFLDVLTDLTAHLDLGLQQLRLDLVPEDDPSLLQEFLDIRGQLSGLGVDDLVLLLDSDGELGKRHSVSPMTSIVLG